jgi:hypothetical protein
MSRAPDFTYELPGEGQHTLSGERDPALVVMYSEGSRPRLAELAGDHRLMHAKLRVIAMPLPGTADGANDAHRAIVNAEVPNVYAQFAQTRGGAKVTHAELLIDASGVVRARWLGVPGANVDRDASIAAALAALPTASKSPAMHHGH